MSTWGSDVQLTSQSSPYGVQRSLCAWSPRWGSYRCLLRLSWRGMGRPKPTQPQPGNDSSVTSSGRARAGTARRPATSPQVAGRPYSTLLGWGGCEAQARRQSRSRASYLLSERVLDLLAGVLEVGPRLVALALIFSALVAGDLADRFLGLTAKLLPPSCRALFPTPRSNAVS